MDENIPNNTHALAVSAKHLDRCGLPTYQPASTPAEAFQAAQEAALAGIRRLLASAETESDVQRLIKDGTAVSLATRCAIPELARFVEDELVFGFAEVIADRVLEYWQDWRFVGFPPRPISETRTPLHESEASADRGVADAVAAVHDVYVEWFADDLPFDALSEASHAIIVRQGRLAAFDALEPYYFPNAAAVMAEIIAETVWHESAAQLAHSVVLASKTRD